MSDNHPPALLSGKSVLHDAPPTGKNAAHETLARMYEACIKDDAQGAQDELDKHPKIFRKFSKSALAYIRRQIAARGFMSVMAVMISNIDDEDLCERIDGNILLCKAAQRSLSHCRASLRERNPH